jgi:hypothetical protein
MGPSLVPPYFEREGEAMLSKPQKFPLSLSLFSGIGKEVRRQWEFV